MVVAVFYSWLFELPLQGKYKLYVCPISLFQGFSLYLMIFYDYCIPLHALIPLFTTSNFLFLFHFLRFYNNSTKDED